MDLCFMCTNDDNCIPVDDRIVSEVEYLIPEITIIKLGIPLRICSVCEGALDAFGKFKRYSVESSRRLESSIRARGAPGPPLHTGRAPIVGHNDTSGTQTEEIEEIYIKEEPVEETWPECHPHINSASLNPALRVDRTSPDTYRALPKPTSLLESLLRQNELHESEMSSNVVLHTDISIKEEQQEEPIQDQQLNYNIMKNICNKEYAESNTVSDNKVKREHKTEEENSRADTREEVWEKSSAEPEKIVVKETHKNYSKNNKNKTKKSTLCKKNFKKMRKSKHRRNISNKIFIRKTISRNKKKVQGRIKLLPCILCKQAFIYKYDWNRHIVLHNGIKKFQCSICKKRFVRKQNLRKHLNTHTFQKNIRSNTSTKTFTETELKNSTEQESSEVNKCSKCHKIFRFQKQLRRHMKNHSEFKEFRCGICNLSFIWRYCLVAHMKVHSGEREFKCNVCNKSFRWKSNLRTHLQLHSVYPNYKCECCSESFTNAAAYRAHKETHSDVRKFICNVCSKAFKWPSNLRSHMQIHSDLKYQCEFCNRLFSQQCTLYAHRKIHTMEKNFQCEICSKTFREKRKLRAHMKIHTDPTRIQCEVCSKSFVQNSDLVRHLKVHSDVKEIECPICKKWLKRTSQLKSHIQRVHQKNMENHSEIKDQCKSDIIIT